MRAQISDALRELQYAVEGGEEFPDAHARITLRFKVDGAMLRDAYDEADRYNFAAESACHDRESGFCG